MYSYKYGTRRRYYKRRARYGGYSSPYKKRTRRVPGRRLFKFKKQVGKTKTGVHLRGLGRQNKVAKQITFPLTRRNAWTVHSGYASFNPSDATTTSSQNTRMMFEWTANHPGMSNPTLSPQHFVGPKVIDANGSEFSHLPYMFVNDGGQDGENHEVFAEGDSQYMVGYQQFLGFPNTPLKPLYGKSIVVGSKLTVLIEPLEDQAGLENATTHHAATDLNGNAYTAIVDVPKYKSNNMMIALIKCKRGSDALKSGSVFDIEAKNPDCQIVTVKAFSEAKNRSAKIVSKFSARGTFGTDLKDDEDIVLEFGAGSLEYRDDGATEKYRNTADKDWVYRLVCVPEDKRYALPDFKLTAVEEMTMMAYDVNKEGYHSTVNMRVAQANAGARASKKRKADRGEGGSEL